VLRAIWIVSALLLMANFAIVVLLTEFAMHPPRMRHNEDVALPAHNIAESTDSTATLVSITALDGTALKAWWFWPHAGATRAVIVCHGIADSAMGSIGFAPLFLKNGYAVLVPESRGHGGSRGFVTFGVQESGDIMQWLAWLKQQGPTTFYGLGESLGGAILLQSLAHGADFRAVIAESSYASFEEIADDRIGKTLGPVFAPLIVREAMLYARLRYQVDLSQADPAAAIAHSHVPILLIHGLADNETPPKHSQKMAKINPAIQLWLVPNAIHTGAYFADPKQFESRILSTFQPAP
jgi:pimeloyl-ACP methyl ester carboxylesterase